MKRLITALMAAAAVPLFADGFTKSGTGFEQLTTGAITLPSSGDSTTDSHRYWTSGDDTATMENSIVAYGEGDAAPSVRPSGVDTSDANYGGENKQYLAVDTSGNTLLRRIQPDTDDALTIPDDGLYFDAMVRFTASDSYTYTDGATSRDGDKLLVWLYGDETGKTNFVVTAGVYENGQTVAKNYDVTVPQVEKPDSGVWYRLTISATTANNATTFEVRLNASDNDKSAVYYDDSSANITFASLVDRNDNSYNSLKRVGFKGTGAIDDLVFTTDNPFPVDVIKYFEVDGKAYPDFASAVEEAKKANNKTIKVLQNYTSATELSVTDTLTLDLNGCTIKNTAAGSSVISNTGNLTIIDSATNGGGSIEATAEVDEEASETETEVQASAISNNGTLIIGTSTYGNIPTFKDYIFVDGSYTVKYYSTTKPNLSVINDSGDTLSWSDAATDGYYTITGGGSSETTTVVPGKSTEVTANDKDKAAAKVKAVAPNSTNLTDDQRTTYASYFTASAVAVSGKDGSFTVTVALNETGEEALNTVATNASVQVLSEVLKTTVADGSESASVSVSVSVTPGFYAALYTGTELNGLTTTGAKDPVGTEGTTTFTVTKQKTDTQGFYRVDVSPEAIDATETTGTGD